MRVVLSAEIFSGVRAIPFPATGLFLKAEPVSSKLCTHDLMA
jgi:hypothetical protein